MAKPVKEDLGRFVERRSSALKVVVRLLHHELDLNQSKEIVLDRDLVVEAVSNVELFLEDFQHQYAHQLAATAAQAAVNRKLVEPGGKISAAKAN